MFEKPYQIMNSEYLNPKTPGARDHDYPKPLVFSWLQIPLRGKCPNPHVPNWGVQILNSNTKFPQALCLYEFCRLVLLIEKRMLIFLTDFCFFIFYTIHRLFPQSIVKPKKNASRKWYRYIFVREIIWKILFINTTISKFYELNKTIFCS